MDTRNPPPRTVKVAAGVTAILALTFVVRAVLNGGIGGIVFGLVLLVLAVLLWKGYWIALRLGTVAGAIIVAIGLFYDWGLAERVIWVAAGVAYIALLWMRGARQYFFKSDGDRQTAAN